MSNTKHMIVVNIEMVTTYDQVIPIYNNLLGELSRIVYFLFWKSYMKFL